MRRQKSRRYASCACAQCAACSHHLLFGGVLALLSWTLCRSSSATWSDPAAELRAPACWAADCQRFHAGAAIETVCVARRGFRRYGAAIRISSLYQVGHRGSSPWVLRHTTVLVSPAIMEATAASWSWNLGPTDVAAAIPGAGRSSRRSIVTPPLHIPIRGVLVAARISSVVFTQADRLLLGSPGRGPQSLRTRLCVQMAQPIYGSQLRAAFSFSLSSGAHAVRNRQPSGKPVWSPSPLTFCSSPERQPAVRSECWVGQSVAQSAAVILPRSPGARVLDEVSRLLRIARAGPGHMFTALKYPRRPGHAAVHACLLPLQGGSWIAMARLS